MNDFEFKDAKQISIHTTAKVVTITDAGGWGAVDISIHTTAKVVTPKTNAIGLSS